MIAGNTMLLTSTALALLEAQGKVDLNQPTFIYFPDYRLYDRLATRMVTIKDPVTPWNMFCMCLPNNKAALLRFILVTRHLLYWQHGVLKKLGLMPFPEQDAALQKRA
jgi:hypothetical protein